MADLMDPTGGPAAYTFMRDGAAAPMKVWGKYVPIDDDTIIQAEKVTHLPFVKGVALMPDAHVGLGATVGSVIATQGAIIPAAVGVDIGCGMMAVRTNLTSQDLPDNLHEVRVCIEVVVPHGRSDNGGANDTGAWKDVPKYVRDAWTSELAGDYDEIVKRTPAILHKRVVWQLGTLGTGNHFIELCLDESDRVWVMLHSGSRGPGNAIGTKFISEAKRACEQWHVRLPNSDLAYLPKDYEGFERYVQAVRWAQRYAQVNRELMMLATLEALRAALGDPVYVVAEAIQCHHNYVAWENHGGENLIVTRKGAVRAREGDLGIIPGSMGAKSYIVRGKGSPHSFHSCSHGAGRVMSRTEAKKRFTVEDHEAATHGVECRKDEGVLDETPGAYKDIDAVMASQADLVEVVHTLKQIVCVKG
jgi:tRNA-splicing ligase RtcB